MSPWIVGFAAFAAYPIMASLFYSFTRYDVVSAPRWVGLENYRFMLQRDPLFWQAMRNTAWMVVVSVPVQLVFALVTAVLLARPGRSNGVYRTIYYLPAMVPAVAATLAFGYLLDPGIGPVNHLLGALRLPEPLWFYDPRFAKPGLVLLALWGVGPTMILFLTGLLNVPRHLYESALLEGAGRLQRFRHVTLPVISPVVLFTLVIGVIGAFQYFTQAYVAAGISSGALSPHLGAPQGGCPEFRRTSVAALDAQAATSPSSHWGETVRLT